MRRIYKKGKRGKASGFWHMDGVYCFTVLELFFFFFSFFFIVLSLDTIHTNLHIVTPSKESAIVGIIQDVKRRDSCRRWFYRVVTSTRVGRRLKDEGGVFFPLHRYTSSKGLVSEKHESQNELMTLPACASSLHRGRAMRDCVALARTQFWNCCVRDQ